MRSAWMPLALVVLLAGVGCGGPYVAGGRRPVSDEVRVTFSDTIVKKHVTVGGYTREVTQQGCLRVQCRLENHADQDLRARYRFRFLDKGGSEYDITPYAPVVLPAGSIATVQATSVDDKAADFTLEISSQYYEKP